MTAVAGPETTVHKRTCHLCEAMCGVDVHVSEGRVTQVRPNVTDVWSKGYLCPKGTVLGQLHEDPDRLRSPMVRTGETWRAVTWPEAFAHCETLIQGVLQRHGKDAFALYGGNPIGGNFALARYLGAFVHLTSLARFSPSTIDQHPKTLSCQLMYGDMWKIPVPDVARTDFFLVLGANPRVSQGSILPMPGVMDEMARVSKRGGKVVVVDPVRTGTAKKADEWLAIVPGTDAAFLLAVVEVLFADGLVDLGDLTGKVNGVEEVRRACTPYTPEAVTGFCGIPAARIRSLAHELAAAPSAAVYGRIGTCTQEFGTLASWLVDVVAILTGNFDRPGGLMFANPVASFMHLMPAFPAEHVFTGLTSRVRGAQQVLGEYPASCLAEEIDTPGEGQVKGLFTIAGNPVLSVPSSGRLEAALPLLECMISVDNYLNETTRHADVILPGLTALESPHFNVWAWIFALRSAAKFHDPLFEPAADAVPEWETVLRLAAMVNGEADQDIDVPAMDADYFSGLCQLAGVDPATAMAASPEPGPRRIAELALRAGPWGDHYGDTPGGLTLEHLLDNPDGVDMGPAVPRIDEVLKTASGKVELAHDAVLGDLARLDEAMQRQRPELVLVSRRQLGSMNSWLHNMEPLVKGRDRCTLQVSPADAERLGLVDEGQATVTSTEGSLTVPVEVCADMSPGVVSLPHGWGHDPVGNGVEERGQRVARRHPGVNLNRLTPGRLTDGPSGNAVLNGFPVSVRPVPAGDAPRSAEDLAVARP